MRRGYLVCYVLGDFTAYLNHIVIPAMQNGKVHMPPSHPPHSTMPYTCHVITYFISPLWQEQLRHNDQEQVMFTSKVIVNKSKYVLDKNVLNETILRKSPGDANVQVQFQRGTILLKEDWKVLVLHIGTLSTSEGFLQ